MAQCPLPHQADGPLVSQADYDECRRVMRTASRNYTFSSQVLPRRNRHHVEALYAFLRVGDDRVDVSHQGFSSPLAAIEDWEASYHRAFETGSSPHPVMRAYLNTALERGIPMDTMVPYFRAMKDDLVVAHHGTFEELYHYMEGSALPVGRAMTRILGVRPPKTVADALPYADSLSIAMQLSNFWRDIAEDWQRGRLYIPQEDMARFGVVEPDMAAARVSPKIVDLLEYEIQRTEHYYEQALPGIPLLASGRWAVVCAMRVYRAILDAIREQAYDVFAQRARASTRQKLWHMAGALWDVTVRLPRAG